MDAVICELPSRPRDLQIYQKYPTARKYGTSLKLASIASVNELHDEGPLDITMGVQGDTALK
jgi:hypothetical protein